MESEDEDRCRTSNVASDFVMESDIEDSSKPSRSVAEANGESVMECVESFTELSESLGKESVSGMWLHIYNDYY